MQLLCSFKPETECRNKLKFASRLQRTKNVENELPNLHCFGVLYFFAQQLGGILDKIFLTLRLFTKITYRNTCVYCPHL